MILINQRGDPAAGVAPLKFVLILKNCGPAGRGSIIASDLPGEDFGRFRLKWVAWGGHANHCQAALHGCMVSRP